MHDSYSLNTLRGDFFGGLTAGVVVKERESATR